MIVVKDLIGGNKPEPILIPYNGTLSANSVTLRYKGSFVKRMDIDGAAVAEGWFFGWGGSTTAMENVVGILAEDQPITGNYLPNHATLETTRRWMYPIFPSTVLRGEFGRTDAAGTANTDTGATGTAASTTLTAQTTGTADYIIGGWVYFLTGANAGYLYYVRDDSGAGAVTVYPALAADVVAADTFLFVTPVSSDFFAINATYTGFISEIDTDACQHYFICLNTYIQAPGVPLQPLSRTLHAGQKIADAKLFADVIFTGATDAAGGLVTNAWVRGITAA